MQSFRLRQSVAFVGLAAFFVAVPSRLGRADAPAGRYTVDTKNGTVADTQTMLTWEHSASSAKSSWSDATTYCTNLTMNGGGWRLPSGNELQTLVDESRTSPAIDPGAFPGTPADFFWTSSTVPSFSNFAWSITFQSGVTTLLDTAEPEWVRCVR